MSLKLLGRKKGMTRRFDDNGNLVACTVIAIEDNVIAQIKTEEKDRYQAVQVASEKVLPSKVKNLGKPVFGHYKKLSLEPRRNIVESRVENSGEFQVGQELTLEQLGDAKFVDVIGTSKGKGFQGVQKRWGFRGGPASHGASKFHRKAGSTGCRSTPGRIIPGSVKMAGQMGNERVTVESLRIVHVDVEKGLLLVEGGVPGPQGAFVQVTKAK